jgi:hypothetical protein
VSAPLKIVIHAGFHKTGTTSIQKTLHENASLLAGEVRVLFRADIAPLTDAARAFSRLPMPEQAQAITRAATALAQSFDAGDPRPICISTEDLAGHIPGRHGISDYSEATPQILGLINAALANTLPQPIDLKYLFTTRDAAPWLRSSYWQHLRATRITRTLANYAKAYAGSADLNAAVEEIRKAVAPAPVFTAPLEAATGQLGPTAPLLDLLEISPELRAQIIPHKGAANAHLGDDVAEALLEINRSELSKDEAQDAKKLVLAMARKLRKEEP